MFLLPIKALTSLTPPPLLSRKYVLFMPLCASGMRMGGQLGKGSQEWKIR